MAKDPIKSSGSHALFIFLFLGVACAFFSSCQRELSCENCLPKNTVNQPPTASAGVDQHITLPQDSVLLDGTGSADPDGRIAAFRWTKLSGPLSSSISYADSPKTLVNAMTAGVYQFELSVTDDGGLSAADTVRVVVENLIAANHAPIANAGPDQVLFLPTNATTLNGAGSIDADQNITTYRWTKITGPATFSMQNAAAAQTQISGLVAGEYQFELQVTDAGNLQSKDTVAITVVVNTLSGQEFIFDNLIWELADFYGMGLDDVYLGTPPRPNLFMNAPNQAYNLYFPKDVYVKFDTTSTWLLVKSAAQFDPSIPVQYVYDIASPYLYVHVYALNYNLVGRKASIKVKFL